MLLAAGRASAQQDQVQFPVASESVSESAGMFRVAVTNSPQLGTAPATYPAGYSGFSAASCTAFDAAGNLYVSNFAGNTVSEVTPAGTVTTFVASSAGLNNPIGLAFDAAGNLYVGSNGNNSIFKVTPSGTVSTFVSSGLSGPRDLAFDAAGNLYVANFSANTVSKVTSGGVVSTFVASTLGLNEPHGLAFDASGNLYVSNSNANTVSKVTSGGAVSTFVASTAGLSQPTGLVFDVAGNLYVANYGNGTMSMVTPGGTVSSSFASGFNAPFGLAFDTAGNGYVPNYGDANGTTVSKLAAAAPTASGTTFASSANFNLPQFVTFDAAGNLYVSNNGGTTVSKVTPSGVITAAWATVSGPEGLAFDSAGNLYVANGGTNTVTKVPSTGGTGTILTLTGTALSNPTGLAFDAAGNLYVANAGANTVSKVAISGSNGTVTTYIPSTQSLSSPYGLAFDAAGNLYISNYGSTTVYISPPGGGTASSFATGLSEPIGLAFDGAGNLYVANFNGNTVSIVPPGGGSANPFYATGLNHPVGLAFDSAHNLYVANQTASPGSVTEISTVTAPITLGGTAVSGTDYTGVAAGTLHFGVGVSTANITGTLLSDPGAGKTLSFTLGTPNNGALGATTVNTLTIVEPPSVTSMPSNVAANATTLTINGFGFDPIAANNTVTLSDGAVGTVTAATSTTLTVSLTTEPTSTGSLTVVVTSDGVSSGAAVQIGTLVTSYALGASSLVEGPAAGSDSVVLAASPATAAWTATANASWLHVATGSASGAGSANVIFTFDANTGPTRTGTMTIGGQTLSITQAGATYVSAGTLTPLLTSGSVLAFGGYDGNTNLSSAEVYNRSTGIWTATGSMTTARAAEFLTTIALPSGQVLVTGGQSASSYLSSAELYDPAAGTWTATGSMSVARYNPAAALLSNGQVLVAGGENSGGRLATAELYDPASGTWSLTGSLNHLRDYCNATVLSNGNVLVAGGHDGSTPIASAELYDPGAGTWSTTGSMNVARYAYASALLPDGTVLVSGGVNASSNFESSAEIYNPMSGTWSVTTPSITVRADCKAAILPNQTVLLAGGRTTTGGPTVNAEIFTTGTTPPWTATGALTSAREYFPPIVFADGAVLAPGGQGASAFLQTAELYHPTTASWSPTGSMTSKRSFFGAALLPSGLNLPARVALDSSGNVYIADSGNNAIKMYSPATQSATTLVSSGLGHPSGVAVDGSGNVYIADTGNNAIEEYSPATQTLTTLVSSGLSFPSGVAVDAAGNVYIADSGNSAIKEYSPATQTVATLVSSGLAIASGVAVDAAGNVYIADTGNSAIKEYSPATQTVTTLVASGLSSPYDVAVDGSGNVYIADTSANAIREYLAATQTVATLSISGLNQPDGVAVDGVGNVYVADSNNNAIEELPRAFVDPTPKSETYAAGSDTLPTVLPSTENLLAPFAPSSDSSWLTVGSTNGGVVSFSFFANTGAPQTAHITLLGQSIPVSQASGAPTVTASIAGLAANAATFTIAGTNFDPTAANNTVTFNDGAAGTVTNASTTSLTVTFSTSPTTAGSLTAVVTTDGQSSGTAVQVATVTPAVTSATSNLAANATTLTINGFGFDPTAGNNTVTFNDGAAGTVASASATSLTVTFSTNPATAGSLTAIVTTDGQSSGAAVPVATVTPVVASMTTSVSIDSTSLTINGFGFDPTAVNNTVTLSDGAIGTVTAATATTLTVTLSTDPTATGNLTASVTTDGQSSGAAVQVATVQPPGIVQFKAASESVNESAGTFSVAVTNTPPVTNTASTFPAGYSGFTSPNGIAVDAAGNVYAGCTNGVIKVTPAGTVSTFATITGSGNSGLAFDSSGNLYTGNRSLNTVSKITPSGAVSTFVPSTAGLSGPCGLAFDASGNLYVADITTNKVSKVTPGGAVSTFVSSGLNAPCGLAFDAAGNLYIANQTNTNPALVTEVTPSGTRTTFVPSGSGLNRASGLAFDSVGNLYVTNYGNQTLSKVTPAGVVTAAFASGFTGPGGLAFDAAGNLYIANIGANTVTKLAAAAQPVLTSTFGSGFNTPQFTAFDAAGNLYVGNVGGTTVSKVTPGGAVSAYATGISVSEGLAFDSAGYLYVANGSVVTEVPPGGGAGSAFATGFTSATGLAFDSAGNLYVANNGGGTVSKVGSGGGTGTLFASVSNPCGLAFDSDGNLYVSSYPGSTVSQVTPGGTVTTYATGLNNPTGLAVDAVGNLYVSNYASASVAIVPPGGGGGATFASGFSNPVGLAFDSAHNLYVANQSANTVTELSTATAPLTLGGTASSGTDYSGVTASPLHFGVGISTVNITGALLPDPGVAKTLTFTLGTPTGATLGSPTVNTLTIVEPPSVTASTAALAANATTLTIAGTAFDSTAGNNSVTFSNGAVGTVTSASTTSLTVTFSTKPTAGNLTAVVTTDGQSSGVAVQVATVTPVVTAMTTNVGINATTFTINGFGFDPTALNNTVTLSDGAVGTVTAATPTSLTVTLSTEPTSLGNLTASVTTDSQSSGAAVQVATIIPVITSMTTSVGINATTLTINGFGFDPTAINNTVALNDGAIGTITAATATSLTVTLSTEPTSPGNLTASVTTDGQSSAAAVQVATVVPTVQFSVASETVNASAGIFSISASLSPPPSLTTSTFASGFNTPQFLAFDAAGNLYVGSANGNTVSKVTPSGAVSTFASGFSTPNGLAFDAAGNLYVANYATGIVNLVTPGGAVSTFASGFSNPTGLAFDPAGNLYVANGSANTVSKVTPGGAVSAFASGFNGPCALVFDSTGNLYVSNEGGSTVSKVTPGGAVSTFASGFNTPTGLAFDAAGNLSVGNYNGATVSQVTPAGTVTTLASGFSNPVGLAFDSDANLYVANQTAGTVSKLSAAAAVVTTSTFSSAFSGPDGLAFDAAGNLYVANQTADTVSKVTPGGTVSTFASGFTSPFALAFDAAGNLYVSNFGGGIVNKVTPGGVVSIFASGFNQADGLAFDAAGNLYVSNFGSGAVNKVTPAGVVSTFGPGFSGPIGLTFDSAGNLYVANGFAATVSKVTPGGVATTYASGLSGPYAVALDAAGNLYIAESGNATVAKLTPGGVLTTFASGFNSPDALAFDVSGNLYVANYGSTTVSKISPYAAASVPFSLSGTAVSGTDYSGVISPLVFGIGGTATITGALLPDGGAPKMLTFTLGAPTGAVLGSQTVNTLTIVEPPAVNASTAALAINAATVTIAGSGFDPTATNNTVTFNDGAVGTVSSASSSSLTVTFSTTPLAVGSLTAVVTTNGQSSGAAVQVAVVAPVVTSMTSSVDGNAATLTIDGFGFDPTAMNNTVTLSNGAVGTVTAATSTSLTVTLSTEPTSAGSLTAIVTTDGHSSGAAVQIAAVLPIVQFSAASENVYQSDGTFSITVTLSPPPPATAVSTSTFASGINGPVGLAFDSAGNLYVSNSHGTTVSKVTPGGTVSTFASGFSTPAGLAFDPAGNLYVANYGANTVSKVTPGGVVASFASGFNIPFGLACDSSGNLYVANQGNGVVNKVTPGGVVSAFASGFGSPTFLAFDAAGNLYVGNGRVSKVTPGGAVSVFASTGGTNGLAIDSAGDVYVADLGTGTVSVITPGGVVSALASGFSGAQALAVDPSGNLYVANDNAGTVSKLFSTVGATIPFTLGGTAVSGTDYSGITASPLAFGLGGVGTITGRLLPDPGAPKTLTFTLGAQTGAVLGSPTVNTLTILETTYLLGTSSLVEGPAAGSDSVVLALAPADGTWTAMANATWLHVAGGSATGTGGANVIFTFDANPGATRTGTLAIGGQTLTITQAGSTYVAAAGAFTLAGAAQGFGSALRGVAVDGAGNVYLADSVNGVVEEYSPATQNVTVLLSGGVLQRPQSVAVDGAGNLYIADSGASAVEFYDASTQELSILFSGLTTPIGVAVDGAGNVYVADQGANAVVEWIAATQQVVPLVSTGLNGPNGVAVDALGNVYIADTYNNAIKLYSPTAQQVTTLLSAGLNYPGAIAVDGSGNLYYTDYNGNDLEEWSAATQSVSLLLTGLNNPFGVAVDAARNLYFANAGDSSLEELPRAFVDPTPRSEPPTAASDILPVVLPATENLLPPFTPTSDQIWLTIGSNSGGVVSFSFSANATTTPQTAHIALFGQSIPVIQAGQAPSVTFNAATDIPISSPAFDGTGNTLSVTLNFAPSPGTNLTVVQNTGPAPIVAPFDNASNGSTVYLSDNGVTYPFIAWYYGGASGRDLVLLWPYTGLAAWGQNTSGQLGNDVTTRENAPVQVDLTGVLAGQTVVALSRGSAHTLALTSNGLVYAWGSDASGQLGNGVTTSLPQDAPVAVDTTSGVSALFGKFVIAISAGANHSLALCSDGTVAAWGYNATGQLGNNSTTSTSVPVAVNATTGVSALFGKTVSGISAGYRHSLALCTDGTVAAWGDNTVGELGNNDPTGAPQNMPVAVYSAGSLSGETVVAVVASYAHSLALCSDGTVAAWGQNTSGQLGNGDTTGAQQNAPVATNTASGVSALFGKAALAIAAGQQHSLALCSDGTVVAWGDNANGQLGDNTTTQRFAPVAVNTTAGTSALSGETVTGIAAGGVFSLAVCADGTVTAWGDDSAGELGNDDATGAQHNAPVSVNTATGVSVLAGASVSALAAGSLSNHSAAVYGEVPPSVTTSVATNLTGTGATLNAAVNPNGYASTAQFDYGLTTAYGHSISITLSPANGSVAQIVSANITGLTAGATYHFQVTAASSEGTAYGSDLTFTTPVSVSYHASTDVPIIASSYDGTGQTLNLTLNFAPTAGATLTVVHNTGTSFIAAPFDNIPNGSTVNLTYNGTTYPFIAWYYGGSSGRDFVLLWPNTGLAAWGDNTYGELGDDTTTQRHTPVAVDQTAALAGQTIVQVARGASHTLALTTEGLVYAWGDNSYGQLGNNTLTGSDAPLAVYSLGALRDKTVVAVAAGANYSLALCSDGTVAAWGDNASGNLGDNTTAQRITPVAVNITASLSALASKTVVAIAAGSSHSLALCSDGTLAAWGANADGQLGDGTTTERNAAVAVTSGALLGQIVTAITAGNNHSLALCSNGTIAAWGDNTYGELGDNTTAQRTAPVAVNTTSGTSSLAGETVVSLAAGGAHSLALCSDGTLAAWGYNADGELGDTTTTTRLAPVTVNAALVASALNGKTAAAIAAGQTHSLALCSDGTVAAWGQNAAGQLGNTTTTSSATAVAVSTSTASALANNPVTSLSTGSQAIDSAAICGPIVTTNPGANTSLVTGSNPDAVAINPITNKAYLLEGGAVFYALEVIDLSANTTTTLGLTNQPAALTIDSAANLIYIACNGEVDVIDGSTDTLLVRTAASTHASVIALNPVTHNIYAADSGAGKVTVIDGTLNTVTATVSISSPAALAVNPVTNEIYVRTLGGSVAVIKGSANTVSTLNLGTGVNASAVGVDPVTNVAYVANAGNQTSPGSVIMVNGVNKSVLGTVTVGVNPQALAVDPQSDQVYVVNASDHTASILHQVAGNTVAASIPVGNQPASVAFNPSIQRVYIPNTGDNTVTVLDSAARAVVETVPVGSGNGAIAVNPLTNQVLTANSNDGTISVLDPDLSQSSVHLGVSGSLLSAAVNPYTNQVYLSEYDAAAGGSIVIIDGATNATKTISTGSSSSAMAVNPITNKIYLANNLSLGQAAGVTVIDGATGAVDSIAAPIFPYPASNGSIAVNPVTNQIYIANGYGSGVTVVDGATNAVTALRAGLIPYAVAVNPAANNIYVANAGDNTVTIFNGATNAAATIAVGNTPVALAVNPATDQIYVANMNAASVSIIDGLTNVVTNVNVGRSPEALAVDVVTNKIYVGNAADHSVTVIDGAANTTTVVSLPIILGAPPAITTDSLSLALDPVNHAVYAADLAEGTLTAIDGATYATTALVSNVATNTATSGAVVNPATHNVYYGSVIGGVASVRVIAPANPPDAGNPLLTAIAPLPGNLLTSGAATVSLSALSAYAPTAPAIQQIYYQLDSTGGAWLPATGSGASAAAPLSGVPPGLHTLYAFAGDGQEAPSTVSSLGANSGNNLIPGAIASYNFLSTPGAFSFVTATAQGASTDVSVTLLVERNFSDAAAAVSYQTLDDTAVAGVSYVATQGSLSFAVGQTQQSISVPLLNTSGSAALASFLVQLSNPTGYNVVTIPSTARVTIINDSGSGFTESSLSDLTVFAPSSPPVATGSIGVNISYNTGTGNGQWRLFGELQWRNPGTAATGLTAGTYEVEFKPIDSYEPPALQVVPISSGQAAAITGEYLSTNSPSVGSLSVTLSPKIGGWRIQGSTAWEPSGGVLANVNTGTYILEFQPAANYVTPGNMEVFVESGQTSSATAVYLLPYSTAGALPQLVQNPNNPNSLPPAGYAPPYNYNGQIQTDSGLGSGFVPLDHIAVTAAHVLFDDVSLSYVTGIRWFFQRERDVFEEPAQIPAGFYVLAGYAAQRAIDNTPDVSSPASQQLDVGVLFFTTPSGRGGQSGYLASNSPTNSWLTGSANKTILGYPADIVDPSTVGDLYATPPTTSALSDYSGTLFRSTAITSYGGNSGGPLCVQTGGVYYPAAIYLGGTDETVVRAIDSQVIDLMTRAEASGNGGPINVGAGVIEIAAGVTGTISNGLGNLTVNIEPPDAVASGAVWALVPDTVSSRASGSSASLAPGSYQVTFPHAVTGYASPGNLTATVQPGANSSLNAAYIPNRPPWITSPLTATAMPESIFAYQITATLEATSFGATGLPAGLSLNPNTGAISGVPTGSGVFHVTLSAVNSVGPGTATLTLTVPPPGQLTVTTSGFGSVTKSFRGVTVQLVGATLSIQATSAAGSIFNNWTNPVTGQVLSTQSLYTISMPIGLSLQANFIPNPFATAAGTYVGLIQGGTLASSGYARMALGATGSFTAVFNLGLQSCTLLNHFNNQSQFTSMLTLPDGRIYSLAMTLSAGGVAGSLTNAIDGSLLSFTATRGVTAPVPHALAALAGEYSAAFTVPSPGSELPLGNGVGIINVTATGIFTFAGALGDGGSVFRLPAATFDATGGCPFYFSRVASAKAGAEIALGRISAVLGKTPVQLTGTLDWFRNPNSQDPAYPAGFYTRLNVTADPSLLLNSSLSTLGSNALITFTGGDLTAPVTRSLLISNTGVVTPAVTTGGAFSLIYSGATRLFTGGFADHGKSRPFTGVLLQSRNEGFGFFQETNGVTGSVFIQSTP